MERYPITSRFLSEESFRQKAHMGVDFAMAKDTPIRTIQEGVIERVVNHPGGLGKAVYVKWVDGKTAIYGHMNDIIVKAGDKVKIGDLIGYSGNTGNVVGANGGYHLHFAIKDNLDRFVDPEPYAPYIQEMNHDLVQLVASAGDGLITVGSGYTDILQQAMDYFNKALQDMDINTIIMSLFDNSPFI